MATNESALTAQTVSFIITKYEDEFGYSELRKSILQKIIIFHSVTVGFKVCSLDHQHQHQLVTGNSSNQILIL